MSVRSRDAASADAGSARALAVRAAGRPRLLRGDPSRRESRAEYQRHGGYAPGCEGDELIAAIAESGLRGRGGAAFPSAVKLRAVAERPGPRCVIANGDEGEPASVKDRYLLRHRPHLVLDGLLRTACAIDARTAYVYVSDGEGATSMGRALDEVGPLDIAVEVVRVERHYVAGDETSAVRAIGGGPALPTARPPRPFESGVDGRPTLVVNVETLAGVPAIAVEGPAAFRSQGTDGSPGTFLMTLSGACRRPGLYEVDLGTPLGEAIAACGGTVVHPIGFVMGGFFCGLLGPRALGLPLEYDALRAEGSGLGCGAIIVLGPQDCPVEVAATLMEYFARENAKQCGACVKGTAAMRDTLARLVRGAAGDEDVERLARWSTSLVGRGACALLDGAAGLTGSLLREFPTDISLHLAAPCPRCAEAAIGRVPAEHRFGFHHADSEGGRRS